MTNLFQQPISVTLEPFIDVLRLLPQHVEALINQFVQNFGASPLAALLLIPIFVAASARKLIPLLAVALLSFVSLMVIFAPASTTSILGVASGLGSFLVALESIVGRRGTRTLHKKMDDFSRRLGRLEVAENRRMLLEIKDKAPPPSVDTPGGDGSVS
jgi:hypothetical protein